MKISAIQPNYVNRFSFRNNGQQTVTTPQTPVEKKSEGLSKNTQTAIGVGTGIVVLAGLVYAGYRGKFGAKIQKLLGGAQKEASKAAENLGTEAKPKKTSAKAPEAEPAKGTTEAGSSKIDTEDVTSKKSPEKTQDSGSASATNEVEPGKIDTDEAKPKKDVLNSADAEDAEIVEEIPYKLNAVEFQNLPYEESFPKFKDDIDAIVQNNDDCEKFFDSVESYFAGLDIDLNNFELTKNNAEMLDLVFDKSIEKFGKQLDNIGQLDQIKLNKSQVKLALGDTESARNLVMDVINSGKMNDARVDAFIMLRDISEKTGNIDESSKILDEAMNGDSKKIEELEGKINKIFEGKKNTVNEFTEEEKEVLQQFSDATFYYDSLFKNLRDIYGETYENGVMNKLRDIMRKAFDFYNKNNIKAAIE